MRFSCVAREGYAFFNWRIKMNKQTEQGFTIVNSLVDEDNYDIMNPEVHKDPDIKYIKYLSSE